MPYDFFVYKYNIEYHGEDFNSGYRIGYMIFSLVTPVIFAWIFRKASKEAMTRYLKIVSVIISLLEVTKVTWESYWDIKTGRGFNFEGILPLETCSMFMYTSLIAGYSKNKKARRCCIDWLVSLGLVGGLSNVFFPQGLRWYPFWTFGALHSLTYHYVMVLTAVLLINTRPIAFDFKDILRAFMPHAIFSAFVITIDYAMGWDYMLYRDPSALPVISILTDRMAKKGLYWVNTVLMIAVYMALDAIFMSMHVGLYRLMDVLKRRRGRNVPDTESV